MKSAREEKVYKIRVKTRGEKFIVQNILIKTLENQILHKPRIKINRRQSLRIKMN